MTYLFRLMAMSARLVAFGVAIVILVNLLAYIMGEADE